MTEKLTVARNADVLVVTLAREDKRNAIDLEMWQALERALQQAGREDDLRALVVRGQGPIFCAGIDVSSFFKLAEHYGQQWAARMRTITADFQAVLNRLESLPLPTLALLHGSCLGLGLELALACDFRLAVAGTRLALPEVRLGLVPDVGGSTRLTRLLGPARAKEMVMLAAEVDAGQAWQWGLVNEVIEPGQQEQVLTRWLERLRAGAPLAQAAAKQVIDGLFDTRRGLELEGWAQAGLVRSEDFTEAVQSFLQKRKAEFQGR